MSVHKVQEHIIKFETSLQNQNLNLFQKLDYSKVN